MKFVYVLAALACTALVSFANDPPAVKGIEGPPAVRVKEPVAAPIAHASVYIRVQHGPGSWSGGTGTVIASEAGKSLILTNAHVVPSAAHPITVTYWSEGHAWRQEATYLGGSSVDDIRPGLIHVNGPDLALLSVNASLHPVEIAAAIPAQGESVRLYGFGGASETEPTEKRGRVLPEPGWVEPATKTSIETINGDSGAGILNDRGELVAVHWGGGAVRLDSVREFTVSVLERKGWFARFKDRLAARKIAKALASVTPFASSPPAVKAPEPAGHWESRCGTDARGRKVCWRVWVPD